MRAEKDAEQISGGSVIPPTGEVHMGEADLRTALEADARRGLSATDKWLAPVYFYDDRGSDLFDQITRLEEYYPTRAERRLLSTYGDDIASHAKAAMLVELGAGTCDKSRILIEAMLRAGTLESFVPLDVSETTLRSAAEDLSQAYPGLWVHTVVADFHRHLDLIPSSGRRLVAFLGGTIGNLTPAERARFLFDVDCSLSAGDSMLIGTDLVKDPARLVAAYDDPSGVTAEFNRNVLRVLNRDLGANFDVEAFDHVAVWDPDNQWIEMRLRSTVTQTVQVPALEMEVGFFSGEEMRTEISAKFTRDKVEAELWEAGLVVDAMWDQPDGDFLLTLASPYC